MHYGPHLLHYGGERSNVAALVRLDPLTDEVHHFLAAQHIPTQSTYRNRAHHLVHD